MMPAKRSSMPSGTNFATPSGSGNSEPQEGKHAGAIAAFLLKEVHRHLEGLATTTRKTDEWRRLSLPEHSAQSLEERRVPDRLFKIFRSLTATALNQSEMGRILRKRPYKIYAYLLDDARHRDFVILRIGGS